MQKVPEVQILEFNRIHTSCFLFSPRQMRDYVRIGNRMVRGNTGSTCKSESPPIPVSKQKSLSAISSVRVEAGIEGRIAHASRLPLPPQAGDLGYPQLSGSENEMENFRLRIFRTVAHHLNFSRAAEELLLTQPAVTQQIRTLEEECGVPLFDRSGGQITLTPAGEALLPYAEKLKAITDEAIAAVNDASGRDIGQLAVGASQTIGQYILPNLVARFLREHPRVTFTAVCGNSDEMIGRLLHRRIQLALIEGPVRRKDFHIEPFMEDHMVLVVPAGHEWADHEIEVSALKRAPLLMREFGSGSRRVVEQALARAGIRKKDLNTRMEFDSTEGILNAVEAGLGATFISRWAVRNQLALGTLKVARVKGLQLSRVFSMVYPRGPGPSGVAGLFRAFLLTRGMDLKPGAAAKPTKANLRPY